MKQIEFRLSLGTAGPPQWYVRSPQVPGLLVAAGTIPDALEGAAKALRNMALAYAMEAAEGHPPRPIFAESSRPAESI